MNINTQVACRNVPRHADVESAFASKQNFRLVLAALAFSCFSGCASAQVPQVLPADARPLCTFEPGEFDAWFETGAVTLNGAVKPKDSLNFSPGAPSGDRTCSFHKWSEQMFLWLTSQARDGRIFQSRDFYRVSAPDDDDGMRTLAKNTDHKNDPSPRASKSPEHGQPGNRFVLMAGNESLVYYATYVNEVYAYFLTGAKTGGITPEPTQFPVKRQELKEIIDFGAQNGMTIGIDDPKARALVVTVKTAWVEATGLDPDKYITVNAEIPAYKRDALNKTLTPKGTKKAVLALVGMHIVGSAAGNSRLIWATFEHVDNAPMAPYRYMSTSRPDPITATPDPAGRWLFSAGSCTGSFNVPRMHARDAPIIRALDDKIEPSDTCRVNAWGVDPQDVNKNTQIIAINRSVMGMLSPGDVRKNYLLIGTVWNQGVGSNLLANTTLETYEQGKDCFSCHRTVGRLVEMNRMFVSTKPLPLR